MSNPFVAGTDLFWALFNNLAIFIVLVAVYGSLIRRYEEDEPRRHQLLVGLVFGIFAIGSMHARIPVHEGVIVDQRNAIIALSGAFAGPLAALLSATMAGAYRIYLGGGGVLAGTVGVCLAAVAGTGLHVVRARFDGPAAFAAGSAAAGVVILPGFLLVGDLQTGWSLLQAMTLPYGTAIFLGIFLVGLLLTHQEHRHHAVASLRENEARLNTILNNVGAHIFIKDTHGRYIYVNQKVCDLFHRPREDIIGRDDEAFFSPSSLGEIQQNDRKVLDEGETVEREEKNLVAPDGQPRAYWTVKLPLRDSKGDIYGLCGISTDITERKLEEREKQKLEERLSQAQKMEAVGTLAGGIAHDFNNILGAVLGYSELVLQQVPEESELAEDVREIVQAGERARELVKQILAFSRKGDHTRKPVQMHLVVGEALRLLRQTIPSSIPIESRVVKQDDTVLADPTQLHQIVVNLCVNAYHAVRETGGSLSVELKPVCVSPDLAANQPDLHVGSYLLLTVSDTGVGMDSATLARALEPFFTTKPLEEGTGMGLSVVHGIVRHHEGAISIDSQKGQGTQVHVYLPQYDETPDSTAEDRVLSLPGGRETILVVDDEPVLARVTEKTLTELGYTVRSLTSSETALEQFADDPSRYDLVLTDQTMPGMTGDSLAENLLALRPDLPIVLCTGFSETVDEEKARGIGIKGFLYKPLDRALLAKTVRRVLDESNRDSP